MKTIYAFTGPSPAVGYVGYINIRQHADGIAVTVRSEGESATQGEIILMPEQCEHLATDLLEHITGETSALKLEQVVEPVASSTCPMCGKDKPHSHDIEYTAEWLRNQARRFWGADVDKFIRINTSDVHLINSLRRRISELEGTVRDLTPETSYENYGKSDSELRALQRAPTSAVTVVEHLVSVLSRNRIMAADSDGNYTKEVTPRIITAAIAAGQKFIKEMSENKQLRAEVEAFDKAEDSWRRKAIELEAEVAKLRGLVSGRSAEYLAAHITYDKGYQEGRLDAESLNIPVAEVGVSIFTWLGDRPPAGTTLYRIDQL